MHHATIKLLLQIPILEKYNLMTELQKIINDILIYDFVFLKNLEFLTYLDNVNLYSIESKFTNLYNI